MLPHKGLSKLSEECAELSQVCSKIMINAASSADQSVRNKKLRIRLLEEIADTRATLSYVKEKLNFSRRELDLIEERRQEKLEKFATWE